MSQKSSQRLLQIRRFLPSSYSNVQKRLNVAQHRITRDAPIMQIWVPLLNLWNKIDAQIVKQLQPRIPLYRPNSRVLPVVLPSVRAVRSVLLTWD